MSDTIRWLCGPGINSRLGGAAGSFTPFTQPTFGRDTRGAEQSTFLSPAAQSSSHPSIPDDLADTAPVPGFDPWAIPGAGGPLVMGNGYYPGEGTLEPDEGDVVAEGHN